MSDVVDGEKPESWLPHLTGLVLPLVVISGNLLGGWLTLSGIVLALGIYPILDVLLGEAKQRGAVPTDGRPFEIILLLGSLLPFFGLATLFYRATLDGSGWTTWAAALSTGIGSGQGIIVAHELGHRKPRSARWWLARVLLFSVHYTHFTTEHNHNHHRNTAIHDVDPASAPYRRGLWVQVARTVPLQFISAVRIHQQRGKKGVRNPVLQVFALQIIAVIVVWQLLGLWVTLAWLVAAVFAIFLLEYVNYIRHWGLKREPGERQTHMHSWQTEARLSRWVLLELTIHPAHHMKASAPFWQLRAYDDAPTLPAGYFACFWPCLFPPLWKRWVGKGIPEEQRA